MKIRYLDPVRHARLGVTDLPWQYRLWNTCHGPLPERCQCPLPGLTVVTDHRHYDLGTELLVESDRAWWGAVVVAEDPDRMPYISPPSTWQDDILGRRSVDPYGGSTRPRFSHP